VYFKFILRYHPFRVSFILVFALVQGCQSPQEAPTFGSESSFNYQSPSFAQGFRWKILAAPPAQEPISCLEIFDVAFEHIETTVYRDSIAFNLDSCPSGERVVLRGVSNEDFQTQTSRQRSKLATLSTTHVALLEAWDDSLEHWAGGSFVDYIQSDRAQLLLSQEEAINYGGNPEWDLEMLISHQPAALCIYPFGNPINDASWASMIPIVPILEYLEPHPLGRAEWMKALGWLVNDSAWHRSNLAFDEIARKYESIRNSNRNHDEFRVFTGSVEQGEWHAPGGGSFIATLLRDAGVTYVFDDRLGRENVRIPLEEMIEIGTQADAWGLVLQHAGDSLTIESLLQKDERNRLILANTRRVFAANTTQCDYFGWWVARPDAMLENLTCLFGEDSCVMDSEPCFNWLPE
jgi:iron complex transport system substrate-binding protein